MKLSYYSIFQLLVIGLTFVLLGSCSKEPEDIRTSLSGRLFAANSAEYLANARVDLVRVNYLKYAARDYILDSTITDARGNYSFNFSVPYQIRHDVYQLVCYYPNFYSTRDITGPFPTGGSHFNLGGAQKYNPELHPYAWLKVKLNFTSPVYRFSMNPAFGEFENTVIHYPSQEEFVVKTMGNADNILSFFIYTPDSSITIIDTIWCGNNDTTFKVINY
mgnify:CR=1 FL=1